MSNKSKILWKAIGMLIAYGMMMAAVIYILNDWMFDKWKAVTWGIFMAFGVWQCYRWFQSKTEGLNDKVD